MIIEKFLCKAVTFSIISNWLIISQLPKPIIGRLINWPNYNWCIPNYDPDHFEVAITLGNLANAYGSIGNPQTQRMLLERLLKIQELHFGPDHFQVAITLGSLANSYGELGDSQTQRRLLERALKLRNSIMVLIITKLQ